MTKSAALREYLPAFEREDDAFLSYWSINPDKTVARSDFTRGEFWALGAAAAGALEEAGLGPGDAAVHYFVVEFDPARLAWADFRGKVLGPTDPAAAPAESLRGTLMAEWEALGLAAAPNTGDNGVHASASPLEGLAERMNWLKQPLETDAFGARLLGAGLTAEMIKEWCVDAQVVLPGQDGKKGSIFDALEDMDVDACLAKCVEISKAQ